MFMYDRVGLQFIDLETHPILGEFVDTWGNKIFYIEKDKETTLQFYEKNVEFWKNKDDRNK